MSADAPTLRRARPLLGTLVSIEVARVGPEAADAAAERAFAAVGQVQALMSFHDPASELSRLNREAATVPVEVHPWTAAVLALAREVAEASDGAFDVTTAAQLVEWGFLPRPARAGAPDPAADWRDVELVEPCRVRFRRPLWIDLGGIAKGWAVDAALRAMALPSDAEVVVNAGGDLRRCGPGRRQVLLKVPEHPTSQAPALEIGTAAVASSTGAGSRRRGARGWIAPHVDGRTRQAAGGEAFATVVAGNCAVADALTKVVLAVGGDGAVGRLAGEAAADALLRRFDATAYRYDPATGWSTLGSDIPGSDA